MAGGQILLHHSARIRGTNAVVSAPGSKISEGVIGNHGADMLTRRRWGAETVKDRVGGMLNERLLFGLTLRHLVSA